jgi:hypothetical protein
MRTTRAIANLLASASFLLLIPSLFSLTDAHARGRRVLRIPAAGRAGAITFSFNSLTNTTADVRKAKVRYFHQQRCRVVGIYNQNAVFFRQAAAHIHSVITSRSFANAMHLKSKYYPRWERTNHNTATILGNLVKRPRRIVVNTFERTPQFPCPGDAANGHTNGFAQLNVGILFLFRNYLITKRQQGASGLRELARTIIHEALHTMGYSHRQLSPGSQGYNNTVPVYVACLVQHWPRAREISNPQAANLARFCTLSTAQRRQPRR